MTANDKTEKLEKLHNLVNKFRNNISQFTDKNYKEQRLRLDFVNEFFELLDLKSYDNTSLPKNALVDEIKKFREELLKKLK
jgi:hypothetical protein